MIEGHGNVIIGKFLGVLIKHDSAKANDGQFFGSPAEFSSGNAFIREFIITQTFN